VLVQGLQFQICSICSINVAQTLFLRSVRPTSLSQVQARVLEEATAQCIKNHKMLLYMATTLANGSASSATGHSLGRSPELATVQEHHAHI
jgi:hypothetical protein